MATPANIQLLAESIIDQIKAGEVIEKPANLLKELLENSVDAGANRIDIQIQNNGMDLISVKDNGSGIPFSELDLAFCRHSTSKLNSFEDLFKLSTFGFRGEALASIASISKLTCESHHRESQTAGKLAFHGGKQESLDQIDYLEHSDGTSIVARDLFFNTPARMKFMRSQVAEKNALKKVIHSFLLSHFSIFFTVKWDQEDKEIYPNASDEPEKRVQKIFKKEHINFLEKHYDDIGLRAYFSDQATRGGAHRKQFIFVNNRHLYDIKLHKIITNSLSQFWGEGLNGDYAVYLSLPPEKIDVNVHPHKTQVKFVDDSKLYSFLSHSLKNHSEKKTEVKQAGTHQEEMSFPSAHKNETFSDLKSESINKSGQYKDFSHYFTGETNEAGPDQQLSTNTIAESGNFQLLHSFEKEYSLIKSQDQPQLYLLAHQKLYKNYIKEQLLFYRPKEVYPLLISEPIKSNNKKIDLYISSFQRAGLEIDRIDSDTLVLRTIPDWMNRLSFKELLEKLCQNFCDQDSFQESIEKTIENSALNFKMTASVVYQLLETYSPMQLQEKELLKEVSEAQIKLIYER